jgi:hypothetical protein
MATPSSEVQIRERLVGVGKRERDEVEEFFDEWAQLGHRDVRTESSLEIAADLGGARESAAPPIAEGFDRNRSRQPRRLPVEQPVD